jgi:hypothetical protein
MEGLLHLLYGLRRVLAISVSGGDRGTCPFPSRCRPPVRAVEKTKTMTFVSSLSTAKRYVDRILMVDWDVLMGSCWAAVACQVSQVGSLLFSIFHFLFYNSSFPFLICILF